MSIAFCAYLDTVVKCLKHDSTTRLELSVHGLLMLAPPRSSRHMYTLAVHQCTYSYRICHFYSRTQADLDSHILKISNWIILSPLARAVWGPVSAFFNALFAFILPPLSLTPSFCSFHHTQRVQDISVSQIACYFWLIVVSCYFWSGFECVGMACRTWGLGHQNTFQVWRSSLLICWIR
jgi:hypothetical protein